jgi:phosphoglycerol transferase MdoB-like AlkP superfamily enzyme
MKLLKNVFKESTLCKFVESSRYSPAYWAIFIYLIISSLTRLVLAIVETSHGDIKPEELMTILPIGVGYDLVASLYLFAPFMLYLFVIPNRFYQKAIQRYFLTTVYIASLFGLVYLGAVEYFFFDEFNARFNFVAVEYLIYPHEVFINIWESYPVAKVLAATFVIVTVLFLLLKEMLRRNMSRSHMLKHRASHFFVYMAILLAAHFSVNVNTGRYSQNRVANELAQNGIYSFFNAAMNSEMDYLAYYFTVPDNEADSRLRKLVSQSNATFIPNTNPIARHIKSPGHPKPLNVIVLLQESLGADFVGVYGDTRGLTPNIDRLAKESLLFTNIYATGTRTVRGMEGVSASFPPVPAESIVKRPNNENMFNWSTVMSKNGYKPTFVYGGFGTFDNMNYFFGNNGYKVVDRTDMDKPNFSNIWGVSDEDLYRNALRIYDEQHAKGEKIFSIIMSTSNHKPFTFPEGVPGIQAKGGGREAGVKYADYAIGKFIEAIKHKPYFDNTLIIIVADHGARVYGKEDIPLRTYEIPFLIYAPKHIKPRKVDILASQIDIAPTILGLLNISYDTVGFGKDIFADRPEERFVLINHNRDIALLQGNILSELSFRKGRTSYMYDKKTNVQTKTALDEERIKNAAAIFQSAYNFYKKRTYRLD